MKLKPSTLLLILAVFLLGTVAYVTELNRPEEGVEEGRDRSSNQPLFSFEENEVQAFTLQTAEQTLAFERQAGDAIAQPPSPKPDPSPGEVEDPEATTSPELAMMSAWLLKSPEQGPANDAYVSYLLNLLATGNQTRSFDATPEELKEYGLDSPQATLEVTLKDGKQHTLQLGNRNFDGSSLYALVDVKDAKAETVKVVLISTDFDTAVNRPLSEWKQSEAAAATPDEPEADNPEAVSPDAQ